MTEEQRKQERKPAAAPDAGKVSDADLVEVSGGTGRPPNAADPTSDPQVGAQRPKPL